MSRKPDVLDVFSGIVIFLALSLAALWGSVMYDDWRCGFIQCRVVVDAGATGGL